MRVSSVWRATVLIGMIWLTGCDREGEEQGEASETGSASPPSAEAGSAPAELGAIDPSLAAEGEALMKAKGCTACHTVGGGRLVGPDLAGVTERRSPQFIVGMIVNPDSMLANDPTARELLGQYFTPMSNQGVTREDARALLEYFRKNDAGGE